MLNPALPDTPPTPPRSRAGLEALAVGALLALYLVLTLASGGGRSACFDELWVIGAGKACWLLDDYRIDPAGGNLPKRLASLPLLGDPLEIRDERAWRAPAGHHLAICKDQVFGPDRAPIPRLRAARAMITATGALLALLIWTVSRGLFGARGALISLALACLSPTLIAHGSIASTDLSVGLTLLLAGVCVWRVLHLVTPWTLATSVLACGLVLVAKPSGALIGPLALALLAIRVWARRPLVLRCGRSLRLRSRRRAPLLALGLALAAVHLAGGLGILWTCYGGRYSMFADDTPPEGVGPLWEETLALTGGLRGPLATLREHRVVPESYLLGLATVLARQRRLSYFRGSYRLGGSLAFFPYLAVTKTPLGTWTLLGLAAAGCLSLPRRRRRRLAYATLPLSLLFVLYGLISLGTSLNLGHRHLVPLYPILFVAGGAAALVGSSRRGRVGIGLALGLLALETLAAFPHYLSFFNAPTGGPRAAWRQVVDSSLDWGQDLLEFEEWRTATAASKPDVPVFLSYFGSINPRDYGVECAQLPAFYSWDRPDPGPLVLAPGYYALSVTSLQSVYTPYPGRWCAPYEARYQQLRLRSARAQAAARAGAEAERALWAERGGAGPQGVTQGRAWWEAELADFRQLRFARLCASLRQRDPDAWAGTSIAIYELDAAQLREALEGPPAELFAHPTLQN